jgi:ubiquinone/menaquinone biosynthesis C-methylase UbiE
LDIFTVTGDISRMVAAPVLLDAGTSVQASAGPRRRRLALTRARGTKNWDRHVENMERLAATPAFGQIRDEILERASLRPSDRVLDIGAGTGLLALAAAPHAAHVSALDLAPAMCRRLEAKLEHLGVENVEVFTNSATWLPLADGSVDVVLSNYCFHHLGREEKLRALQEIARVLRPGGRLVFGDMMFRVGLAGRRDRRVMLRIAIRMVAHGPAGAARLLRNAARLLSGRGERPAPADWWQRALEEAGFVDVRVYALDHEGGIASAFLPGDAAREAAASAGGSGGLSG